MHSIRDSWGNHGQRIPRPEHGLGEVWRLTGR